MKGGKILLNYFISLFISLIIFVFGVVILIGMFYMYRKANKITLTMIFYVPVSILMIILSGYFLINYVRDLPNVMFNNTEIYLGKCKISTNRSNLYVEI